MVHLKGLGLFTVAMVLSLPAYADRGNDSYKHGVRAERQADFDAAYGYYKGAYGLTPNNPKYFAAYMRMRFKAATEHVHSGQALRNKGALKEALAEFQHAVEIDTTSSAGAARPGVR
jgi:tetratricopeptide (TPR) repeat protein